MNDTIADPRAVDAGRGAAWWAGGWTIFASNFLTWVGIVLIYYIISLLLGLLPIVGSVGQALLTPVFMGGIMLGCRAIERDGILRVAHLFEGFQGAHFVPLMVIGAVNLALIVGLVLLGTAGAFSTVGVASMVTPGLDPLDALQGSLRAMTGLGLLMGLVVLVLVAVFAMLNWFAPALVVLHGVTGWRAMQISFIASLRNWLPFLVYGLIALAVMIVAGVVVIGVSFGLLASAFSSSTSGVTAFIAFMVIVGVVVGVMGLVVGPIVFGSTFAAYRDIFVPDIEPAAPATFR